jgi:hypothetical protein
VIDNVAAMVARAAAGDLTPAHGPRLTAAVEAAIQANGGREKHKTPDQYIDPIAVGALIVAIAQFGYQVYTDRKKRGQNPTREGIAQAIRIERRKRSELTGEEIEIIEIISAKLIEQADDQLREPESGRAAGTRGNAMSRTQQESVDARLSSCAPTTADSPPRQTAVHIAAIRVIRAADQARCLPGGSTFATTSASGIVVRISWSAAFRSSASTADRRQAARADRSAIPTP